MTMDANQIAKMTERREEKSWRGDLHPPKPPAPAAPKPKRGTLNVWRHLQDMVDANDMMDHFEDVTVRLDVPGAIVMTSEEESTYLLYPGPGWYVEFIPNDEGE